jgi:hypothetical protein
MEFDMVQAGVGLQLCRFGAYEHGVSVYLSARVVGASGVSGLGALLSGQVV